jgi:hypothetical protein
VSWGLRADTTTGQELDHNFLPFRSSSLEEHSKG